MKLFVRRVNGKPFRKAIGSFTSCHIFLNDGAGLLSIGESSVDIIGVGKRKALVFKIIKTVVIQMKLMNEKFSVPKVFEYIFFQHLCATFPFLRFFLVSEAAVQPSKLIHCLINAGIIAVHNRHGGIGGNFSVFIFVRKVPRVDGKRSFYKSALLIKALFVRHHIINAFFKLGENFFEPFIVTRCFV